MDWVFKKNTLENIILQMEVCDLGFVIEERPVRAVGRSPQSSFLRTYFEKLHYFKKLKSSNSSMGDLQACVTLGKLRQGALMWWLKPEPLGPNSGKAVNEFLLDRARLLCEWDFTELNHTLPDSPGPLFPNYLYLFKRESKLDLRQKSHPKFIKIKGKLKSHIEVPILLGDALDSYREQKTARENWKITRRISPTPQSEWSEAWPDSSTAKLMESMDSLAKRSSRLGQIATIKSVKSGPKNHAEFQKDPSKTGLASPPGFLFQIAYDSGQNRVVTTVLPQDEIERKESCRKGGLIIMLPESRWVAPIAQYLMTPDIQCWLNLYAERKKNRWKISEATLKFIPIPNALMENLKNRNPYCKTSNLLTSSREISRANNELIEIIEGIEFDREETLDKLNRKPDILRDDFYRSNVFIKCSNVKSDIIRAQMRLDQIVGSEGQIKWQELLKILPKKEKSIFTMHPEIKLSGSLPHNLPITLIELNKSKFDHANRPIIALSVERGMMITVSSGQPALLQMVWEQIENLDQPTWGELTQFIFLPKDLEFARKTANDISRAYQHQQASLLKLSKVLEFCSKF